MILASLAILELLFVLFRIDTIAFLIHKLVLAFEISIWRKYRCINTSRRSRRNDFRNHRWSPIYIGRHCFDSSCPVLCAALWVFVSITAAAGIPTDTGNIGCREAGCSLSYGSFGSGTTKQTAPPLHHRVAATIAWTPPVDRVGELKFKVKSDERAKRVKISRQPIKRNRAPLHFHPPLATRTQGASIHVTTIITNPSVPAILKSVGIGIVAQYERWRYENLRTIIYITLTLQMPEPS